MTYEQALDYLGRLDTIPYGDDEFAAAISKAQDALRDCLAMGLTGEGD